MASNKDLERRIAVLEVLLEAQSKMLVSQGTVLETHKNGLDLHAERIEKLRGTPVEGMTLPFVSFEWNPALKLWRVQLNNVDDFLKEILKGDVSVIHDHPKQAFEMLLQKLQRKVS